MTKIAIISQPEQGVLIDVSGCQTLQEATQHLTYTLQVSSQFWEDQPVDLNLGSLSLTREQLGQVLATLSEVNVRPRHVFATALATRGALRAFNLTPATGRPATLPAHGSDGVDNDSELLCDQALAALESESEQAAKQPLSPLQTRETVAVEVDAITDGEPAGSDVSAAAASQPAALVGENIAAEVADATQTAADRLSNLIAEPTPPGEPAANNEEPGTTTAQPLPAAGENCAPGDTTTKSEPPAKPAATAPHVLYLKQTLRSGQAVSHKGHLVIIGDVNPGAEVIAEGDITIWGALRGIAHAGVGGNINAEIRALRFDPIQLRIAHAIARSPDRPKGGQKFNGPETARIVNGTIRIACSAPD
jgi:septum site-determining protein MinC